MASCTHVEPPRPPGAENVAPLPNSPSGNVVRIEESSTIAAPARSLVDASPPLVAVLGTSVTAQPGTDLAQTQGKPSPESVLLQRGIRALFDAMAHDDPVRAEGFFFPVGAYKQVKDVANPERDWRYRLLAEYNKDIHDSARELGRGREDAQFLRLEIPERNARWVEPGEEWNKVGYYRVYNAQIVYTLHGREKRIPIKSMISWRGEWYCVHLRAIARKKDAASGA